MSRMYDRILPRLIDAASGVKLIPAETDIVIPRGSGARDPRLATVISIDNVNDLFYETNRGKGISSHIPGMAPPFDVTFMECRSHFPESAYAYGLLLYADKYDGLIDMQGWELGINLFMEAKKRGPVYPLINCRAFVSKEGRFAYHKDHCFFYGVRPVDLTNEENMTILENLLGPFKLALSFMNCKNVELIDNPPPVGLSRKHERRTGQPLVTYKTIRVNPMRTVKHPTNPNVPVSPKSNGTSQDMSLFIVRGHFKDFRDGKGLFGNPALKGVYWWESHVRGSIENGIIIKDYDVLAPKRDDAQA